MSASQEIESQRSQMTEQRAEMQKLFITHSF